MNESNTRKPLHELSNTINNIFYTLEFLNSINNQMDQNAKNLLNLCLSKKEDTINQLQLIKSLMQDEKQTLEIKG